MYLSTPLNDLVALDAVTGAEKWRYHHEMKIEKLCCGLANRGVSLGYGAVYMATADGRLIAFDMETGAVKWDIFMAVPDTDPTAHALIRRQEIAQVFGIELFRQRRRADQVAEHHGDLAPLRRARRRCGHRVIGIEHGDLREQLFAMPKTKPERLKIRLGECTQNFGVDVVLFEQLGVVTEAERFEPCWYVHASSRCARLA